MANNVPVHENSLKAKNQFEIWGFGCYPPGYDRKVHGIYDPARYYGPKDLALSEVKVGDLFKWIGRRNKSPQAVMACYSRARFRWQDKFTEPRKAGVAAFVQFVVLTSTFFYCLNWKTLQHHKTQKYHW